MKHKLIESWKDEEPQRSLLDRLLGRPATVRITRDQLAIAMHAVDNAGRVSRFGAAYCQHEQQANQIIAYLRRQA